MRKILIVKRYGFNRGYVCRHMCAWADFDSFAVQPRADFSYNFVICISAYVLGTKKGTLSCILYLLIGLAGLPVFSGFSGGAAKMLGPTGGYLIGFIFQAVIAGLFIDRFPKKRLVHILGMAAGVACAICSERFGWLTSSGNTFLYSILIGVVPYLPGDAVKIAAASLIGPKLRQAVRRGREA